MEGDGGEWREMVVSGGRVVLPGTPLSAVVC